MKLRTIGAMLMFGFQKRNPERDDLRTRLANANIEIRRLEAQVAYLRTGIHAISYAAAGMIEGKIVSVLHGRRIEEDEQHG